MSYELPTLFSAAAGGVQYAPSATGLDLLKFNDCGATVIHPASTTTAYTLQVSNMTKAEADAGVVDDWVDYTVIGSKSSAEKFAVDLEDPPYARVRLKMDTSVGTAVIQVRYCVK